MPDEAGEQVRTDAIPAYSLGQAAGTIGCAGFVALAVLPFGVLGALMTPNAPGGTLSARIATALLPSGVAFIAALLLSMRDGSSRTLQAQSIRSKLLSRHDINESDYLAHFPDIDPTLMVQTRQAIANFFQVPVEKIHPTDHLRDDLKFGEFEPGFHVSILYHVLAARRLEPASSQNFWFNSPSVLTAGDLAKEVQRVIDGLKYS